MCGIRRGAGGHCLRLRLIALLSLAAVTTRTSHSGLSQGWARLRLGSAEDVQLLAA